jgi:hypothetical protein
LAGIAPTMAVFVAPRATGHVNASTAEPTALDDAST